jgi:hypothetical protein
MLNKAIADRKKEFAPRFLGNFEILLLDQAKLLEYIGCNQV